MELAGAGVFLTHIAQDALWLIILVAVGGCLFLAWLHKLETNRELKQRTKRNPRITQEKRGKR